MCLSAKAKAHCDPQGEGGEEEPGDCLIGQRPVVFSWQLAAGHTRGAAIPEVRERELSGMSVFKHLVRIIHDVFFLGNGENKRGFFEFS